MSSMAMSSLRRCRVWARSRSSSRECRRGQCFQLVGVLAPKRRGMPADHELKPAARVEFGEYCGDEVFLARRPRHGEVDRPGHFRQRQARLRAGVAEAGRGDAGQPDRGQSLAPGIADQPPRVGAVGYREDVAAHPGLGRRRQVPGCRLCRGQGLGYLAQQSALRDPGHRTGLTQPLLRRAAQHRVGDRERGQQNQHGQPGGPASPPGCPHRGPALARGAPSS